MAIDSQELRIHKVYEQLAATSPHQTAVIYRERTYTYAYINNKANQLARVLIERADPAGVPVGVYIDRSPELIVAMLAIMKSGGICVFLQPGYPAKRLMRIAAYSAMAAIIDQASMPATFAAASIPRVTLDLADLDSIHSQNLARDISADSPAMILFTSGSTGEPKGVTHTHASMMAAPIQSMASAQTAHWVIMMRSAIGHVTSAFELINPIAARCPVVILPPGEQRENQELIRLIRKYRVTRLYLTPSHLHELLREPGFADCNSLERVGASGEPLPYHLRARFFAVSDALLVTTYGCTEHPNATTWQCKPDEEINWPILGRPTPGTTLYLLDDERSEVACGEVGEIYLGGIRLAAGYWGRPGLTARRLLANPFDDQAAPRLYRTGDLARRHEDGTLEFVGRRAVKDRSRQLNGQVKIRGFRVELGEIETIMDQHPQIDQCAVIAVDDPSQVLSEKGWRIIAYFSTAAGNQVTVNDLRDHLAKALPDFMIPARFIQLERLPRTTSGKINRAALPDPGRSRPQLAGPFVSPRSTVEEIIAESWREVLGLDEIGVQDDFIMLGGHSLAAMRIINRLNHVFDAELRMIDLLQHATIADLAAVLQEMIGR